MSIALVQKTTANAFTSTVIGASSPADLVQTAHFSSNTTAGSTLLCVVSGIDDEGSPSGSVLSGIAISTSGFSWTSGTLEIRTGIPIGGNFGSAGIRLFWIVNASSMSSGTNTTATITASTSANAMVINVDMYEFSGVQVFDTQGTQTGTGVDGFSPTDTQELFFLAAAAYKGSNQGSLTTTSGYTAGNYTFNSVSSKFLNCQQQYLLSSTSSGSQTIKFGTTTAWNSGTAYSIGNVVTSGGTDYSSTQNSNINHSPPNASWWSVTSQWTGSVAAAVSFTSRANGTATPSGVSAASAKNNPTASGDGNVSVAGVTAASAVGTATASAESIALPSGVSAASAVNNPTATGDGNVAVDGVAAESAVGSPTASGTTVIPGFSPRWVSI